MNLVIVTEGVLIIVLYSPIWWSRSIFENWYMPENYCYCFENNCQSCHNEQHINELPVSEEEHPSLCGTHVARAVGMI